MKLKRNEMCPIHRSRFCCGREKKRKFKRHVEIKGPVTRVPDPEVWNGYRELCSPAEMRRRMIRKLGEQNGKCAICGLLIDDFREATADHIEVRGMGAAWRDDSYDNIRAVHGACNTERGSRPA